MKKRVYYVTHDDSGRTTWTKVGDFETWREANAVRTLSKESRKDHVSVVYDDHDNYICTP